VIEGNRFARAVIHRLGSAHFSSARWAGTLESQKAISACATRCKPRLAGFHFAVAKATLVPPASLQIFKTPTTFL